MTQTSNTNATGDRSCKESPLPRLRRGDQTMIRMSIVQLELQLTDDPLHNFDTCEGLPSKQANQHGIQSNMGVSG